MLGISLLNITTFCPSSIRFLAILAATVVLALPGLPAIMLISPLVIPDITLSSIDIPVLIRLDCSNIDLLVFFSSSSKLKFLLGCSFIKFPIVV